MSEAPIKPGLDYRLPAEEERDIAQIPDVFERVNRHMAVLKRSRAQRPLHTHADMMIDCLESTVILHNNVAQIVRALNGLLQHDKHASDSDKSLRDWLTRLQTAVDTQAKAVTGIKRQFAAQMANGESQ